MSVQNAVWSANPLSSKSTQPHQVAGVRANPVTRVSKGRGVLVCINLAQEARQSKPPLMHCADWAYNIIPAVTAMVRAAF